MLTYLERSHLRVLSLSHSHAHVYTHFARTQEENKIFLIVLPDSRTILCLSDRGKLHRLTEVEWKRAGLCYVYTRSLPWHTTSHFRVVFKPLLLSHYSWLTGGQFLLLAGAALEEGDVSHQPSLAHVLLALDQQHSSEG